MSRSGMHESVQKNQRQGAKTARRTRKRARRADRMRRRQAEAEHGRAGRGSCGRKCRYPSELAALRVALACMRRGAPPLWAYRCPICHGWHLTSHPRGYER